MLSADRIHTMQDKYHQVDGKGGTMKKYLEKAIATLLAIIAVGLWAGPVYTAVSGEVLMNLQNPSVSGAILAPVRLKDGGAIGNNITAGIMPVGLMLHDGTNWDKIPGDTTNGLDVDVTRITGTLTITGNITPADALANPSTAVNGNALISGFNGATWDRVRTSSIGSDGAPAATTGIVQTKSNSYVFNGSTWDRVYSGITMGSTLVDNTSNATNNITTDTTTTVKATGGVLNRVIVNTAGTAPASIALYNIASAGCTGTPASGYVATLSTEAANVALEFNHTFTLGICAVTVSGATDANVSALYR